MKGFLAVVAMSFRTYWRDKSSVFWGMAFPILLMGLIGTVFGSTEDNLQFTVSLVQQGEGRINVELGDALRSVPVFTVVEEGRDQAVKKLRSGDRTLVVVIPDVPMQALFAGSQVQTPPLQVFYDEGRAQVSQTALAIVRQVVQEANKQITQRPDILTVQAEGVSAARLGMFDFLLPGIIAMTIMQTGLMGVTWVIANYRERLVLKRVLTTPIRPFAFLSGLVARFTVINLLQAVIIFVVATWLFGAKTVGSLWYLGLFAIIGSVTFLAIGFAISTLAKTAETANTLGSVVNFPMMFLSGTFWPKEMLPAGIRPLVQALPLTPLVDAMRGIATRADSFVDHWQAGMYLLVWAAIGFAVAAWRFRWE